MNVITIDQPTAAQFIAQHHYAVTMPAITKLCLGGYVNDRLVAVATWGYGTRPLHTIRKIFPALESKDYLELGRLCILDEMPRNTESKFISICVAIIRKDLPHIQVLYSWADGFRGKPGYVYQASNWLYGGFITTDAYVSTTGELIHPRRYQNMRGKENREAGMVCGKRPTMDEVNAAGWRHIFGKQFRYCLPLKDRDALLRSSPFDWTLPYPKHTDLAWRERTADGKVDVPKPIIAIDASFRQVAQ